ncbi:heat shock protein Hsp20 domain-containing protein [Dictyostelium discoideum AX4]|uniref:Small heat shock protein hspJ n=1 Tax=Dictyostelium discoideum TaxID=44689 RepID=HSPJ_DICDI|nr:heat shock protein Hsp20 domain-containing protein [Dictyostelium discoideum AX4]Q54WT6.1 RecName: Full=Small heat shock protein hspJ [Dictyostelium discoideum]EAL67662.1 heat shock protein Hsp20 domain-containing protein [Dictyostelium discoideum AX4]|eukprot:XP_641631.1 heat shock protein Hsp20 domain-containing protein [Dictyostelium discoideum AX4]
MSCSIILPNLINFINNDNNNIFEKNNEIQKQQQEEENKSNQVNNILNSIIESKFTSLNPKLKIQETPNQYQIKALIPLNFNKEEISVNVKNNRLIISAFKEIKFENQEKTKLTKFEKYQKTINVSNKNLDFSSIKAQFKDNTLTITIFKQSFEKEIKINIE